MRTFFSARLAQTATVYTATIDLADMDRNVYETLELRVARHPSETAEYMLVRILAYCLEYQEGIALTEGVSSGSEPALVVRDLTEPTHGNATGIGMAEFCRSRVVEKTDVKITRINCLTGGHPTAAMLPLDYASDKEILDAALPTIGLTEPPQAKLMWIHNTLEVAEVECSVAYLNEARERSDLTILRDPRPLPLDAAGNLPDRV